MKYFVDYNVIIPHMVEVEADSVDEAKMLIKSMSEADIIQDFAEKRLDYSNADIEMQAVLNEDGDYLYDGIGIW